METQNLLASLKSIRFHEDIRYCVNVSDSLYESLKKDTWLESGAVDFFFKHFDKSYNDSLTPHVPLRCWTVFMFEKFVPSAQVSQKVQIKYDPVQNMGRPFANTISIFEAYPIMLMPLNQDQSHFVLGAIVSKF